MLIHQAIDYHARRRPSHKALITEGTQYGYHILQQRSINLAQFFLVQGIVPGERIGLLGQNSIDHMVAFTACSRIGAVSVPLNYRLAPPETAYVCDDANIRLILILEPSVEILAYAIAEARDGTSVFVSDLNETHLSLSKAMIEPPSLLVDTPSNLNEQDATLQLYTSGTTGKPKGVALSHRNLTALMNNSSNANPGVLGVDGMDLVCAPMFHIGGAGSTIVPLLCGGAVVMHQSFEPTTVLEAIQKYRIREMFMVPAMILSLLRDVPNFDQYDLSSLDVIGYGAAPISPTLLKEAVERFKCGFNQYYGMTETCGTVVALSPETHQRALQGEPELLQAAGQTCLGVEAKVCDENGNEVPLGETGEIWLRSANSMLHYFNLPEATAKTLIDGWVLTGDAGFINEEGFIFLRDRIKDMVVSGGENIYPVEVENVLAQMTGVRETAVIGVPDEKYGEALLAFIALNQGFAPPSTQAMIDFCRDKLAGYKIPRRLEIIDALPRNSTGKIQKMVLREPYWQQTNRQIG
ncbi:MAG: long-chain-fatty-acid--CoA ligase [Halieaceae bacterium]|nr:long-chain-fatty-acid--CoA ligase [Halieaceae bacterium]